MKKNVSFDLLFDIEGNNVEVSPSKIWKFWMCLYDGVHEEQKKYLQGVVLKLRVDLVIFPTVSFFNKNWLS